MDAHILNVYFYNRILWGTYVNIWIKIRQRTREKCSYHNVDPIMRIIELILIIESLYCVGNDILLL